MNDVLNDPKNLFLVIGWLCSVLMGLVMYTWRKNDAEQDRRIIELEKNSATREYIDRYHKENSGRLDRIEHQIDTGITGVHNRIDKIFDRLPERK